MTKRLIDISIIIVDIVFLCWYIPVAFFNVYACDDYWFGTNVRIYGFWGYQFSHWLNWEGSYTHTFLASLPHAFTFSHMPFYGNMFSLLLFFSSIHLFLKTYTSLSIRRCLIYSLYYLSFLYLCTKGNSEIRFWICANITYVSEMSILLILFSLYHTLNKETTYMKRILIFFIIFLIGGSKLDIIIYAISGLIIHDVLFEKVASKYTIIVYVLLTLFVILNISAPGNYIRLEEETMPKDICEQMTMLEVINYRVLEMEPFLLSTLFLLPIVTHWKIDFKFKKNSIAIALAIFLVTFILDTIIMYICFKDSGPLRVYFITEVCVSIIVLFLLNKVYSSVISKYQYERIVIFLFSIWVAISNIPMLLQVADSIDFSNMARERDKYVASCDAGDTIKISPLPDSHLMLSYFANDEIWLERIYLPYFQKNNKFILLESSKVDDTEQMR